MNYKKSISKHLIETAFRLILLCCVTLLLPVAVWAATTVGNNISTDSLTVDTDTLYVDATNNLVGIGTTSPTAKLSITNTGSDSSFVVEDSASPDSTPFMIDASGQVGIGTASETDTLLYIKQAGAPRLRIESTGGSDSPTVALKNTVQEWSMSTQGTSGDFLINSSAAGGDNEFYIQRSTGNVGIGITSPSQKLHVEGNMYVNGTGEFEGIINTNSNWISGDGGAEGLIIDSAGQVGIGTSSPAVSLDISGTARIGGYIAGALPYMVGNAGALARVTDGVRGLWMDSGSSFFSLFADTVNVQEFGALCDGSTDDASAIQDAIDAFVTDRRGGHLIFPASKICRVASTLTFSNFNNGIIDGNGVQLEWVGDSTGPIILVQDVATTMFRDLNIRGVAGYPVAAAIRSENGSGSQTTPTGNQYEHITIQGLSVIEKGWQFALGAGGDNNNDLNAFINCSANNYTVAGWSFEHAQSVGHLFLGSKITGGGVGQYGVTTALGTGIEGGSFVWIGGGGSDNTVADFYMGNLIGSTYKIQGFHSEGSGRFVEFAGSDTANSQPFTIEDSQWEGSGLNADSYAIVLKGSGPFAIRNNRFSGTSTHKISITSAHPTELIVEGNDFDTLNSETQASIVDTSGVGPFRIVRSGNIYRDASGDDATRTDDVLGVSIGGTGLGSITAGLIPFGNGTSAMATSSSLYFDSAADNFGIGTTSPTSKIHGVDTLDAATGNEVAYELDYTTNKATSGNDTGLLINMTDTASPGTSYLIDAKVGGSSKFNVDNTGAVVAVGGITSSGGSLYATSRVSSGSTNPSTIGAITYSATITNTGDQIGGLALRPTYNQTSGTAANTDLLINRTETAVGSGNQYLMDAQVGSISKFVITNGGYVGIGTTIPSAALEINGGVVSKKVTADPCGAGYPEAVLFYNDTSDYYCFCDGNGDDLKVSDNLACF